MPAAKAATKKAAPSHPPYKQMIAETLKGQGKKEKSRERIVSQKPRAAFFA